jgi:hypothetical protein
MSIFTKNRIRKSVRKVTEKELRASKSTFMMTSKLIRTGQLTENSVIFDDIVKGSGINVHLSLIFRDKAPVEFNVLSWYRGLSDVMKERVSSLMLNIVFNEEKMEFFLKSESGTRLVRCITSDVVTGENRNLIGYLFNIEYLRR